MSLLASSRAWTTAAVVATAAGVSYWYLKHSTLSSSGKQRVTGAVVEDGKATIQAPLVRPEDVKGEIRVAKLLIHPIKVRVAFCIILLRTCSIYLLELSWYVRAGGKIHSYRSRGACGLSYRIYDLS